MEDVTPGLVAGEHNGAHAVVLLRLANQGVQIAQDVSG